MQINTNYANLQDSYLFLTIAKKVAAYTQAHPENRIIRMGIGDVTQPLVPAVIEATYDGQQLDIRCRRGETNLIDILGVLERSGTNIGHLTSRPPRLNDVFLELTGTALRD